MEPMNIFGNMPKHPPGKVLMDYKDRNVPPKPTNLNWKQYYIELGTSFNYIKKISIYFDRDFIGYLWISSTDMTTNILNNSNKLYLSFDPNNEHHPDSLSNGTRNLYWSHPLDEDVSNRSLYRALDDTIPYHLYQVTDKLIYFYVGSIAQMALAPFMSQKLPKGWYNDPFSNPLREGDFIER